MTASPLIAPCANRLFARMSPARCATFACSLAMIALLAPSSNAFGEMMHGRRLISAGGGSGSSGGSHGDSIHDSVSGGGEVRFDSPRFASFSAAPSNSASRSSHAKAPSPSSARGASHHGTVLRDWSFLTNFVVRLPHLTESLHLHNDFSIVKDHHEIDFTWSHHSTFDLHINTPRFHEDLHFSTCFEISWHWEPGKGFSFSEHLEIDRHFDLQLGHLSLHHDIHIHKDISFGWGDHHSGGHHGCGCHHEPPPPPPCAVPEPGSMALFGLGGIGLIAGLGRRRRQ
eukprot:TRINITY_DN605_c0_g1_i11.p1 TRINITY_DN605_c0_g1~~TRINITY_DN605_c0_g1_i11.p1  ORF type:complete len:285 (+),score=22.21 TRINITY_DN605_c0_g1_i11:319-1173(+)